MTATQEKQQAVTPVVERKGGGMRRWMFFEPYWSDIGGKRFLTRFVVFFTPWAGLHVTRVHSADDQREYPHDHTRTFWSWKLGSYDEDVYSGSVTSPDKRHVRHRRFGVHRLRHDQAHSITRVSPRLVTVLVLGPHRHGSGYWTPQGKQSLGMPVDEWS
jgi:hypothetical protein